MNRRLLKLTPKRYLCPYCGQWHDWPEDIFDETLDWYDNEMACVELSCDSAPPHCNAGCYDFWFRGRYLYYSTEELCERGKLALDSKIAISDIVESTEQPIVTFEVPFKPCKTVGPRACADCDSTQVCTLYNQACKKGCKNIKITFGFEFDEYDYNKFATHPIQKKKSASKQQLKEDATTMANNPFNINVEFGINTDEDIASTLMGIAVKNGDSWRIYDKVKGEITDLGGIELVKFPLCIMPTTKPVVGDLIKEDGEYYYVMEVAAGTVKSMHAGTGEIKTSAPIKNLLGIDCYSKVVALIEPTDIIGDMDPEKLAIMSAMSGQAGGYGSQANQMNLLVPLLLFSDKLGGDDYITKIALVSAMSAQQPGEDDVPASQMSQLALLMLFSDKLGGSDDITKMVLMSSMMSGNNAAATNPLMGVMMLKMLNKKDKGQPPTPAQLPAATEQLSDAEEAEQSSQQPTE